MTDPLRFFLITLGSYLTGAIPFAYLIAKQAAGIDIRRHGSGNVGATNVLRVVGKRAGALCFVCDFLKGLVPVLLAQRLLTGPVEAAGVVLSAEKMWLIAGAAAIIGHCFPVYLMTVGGKGIATSLGVFGALMPLPTLALFVIGVSMIWATGYVALASVVCSGLLPLLAWLRGYYASYIGVTAALAVIIAVRHQSNLRRLLAGQEPRVWDRERIPDRDHGVPPAE